MTFLGDKGQIRKYEKNLVAEQPGLFISLCGLTLALFMGVAIQSAISSEKILPLIDRAASNMDRRVQVRVQAARVSLANGIFPEIAIVVSGVHIESNEACWMRPILEVNELKLPLSFLQMLNGKVEIHEIYADEATMSLRSPMGSCDQSASQRVERESATEQPSEKKSAEVVGNAEGVIDHIHVGKFQVHYLPVSFTSFLLKNFDIDLKNQSPRHLQLKGIIQVMGETLSGEYSSTAFLNMNYDETIQPQWKGVVTGNWREGSYSLLFNYHPQDSNYGLKIDMNHIPVSQMLPLLKKYRLVQTGLSGKQVWLSVNANVEGKLNLVEQSKARLSQVRLEGNAGEFIAKDVEVTQMMPLQYRPITIDVKSLNFDQLLVLLNRHRPHPVISQLGTFHGQMVVKNENEIFMRGEHSGLEFAFSNGGSRQIQTIAFAGGEAKFLNKKWKISVDRIKPVEGVFLGKIDIDADRDWQKITIRSRIDDLTFGPQVQKIMTGGGDLGAISGELHMKLDQSEVADFRGHLNIPQMVVEQVALRNSKLSIATRDEDWFFDLRIQNAKASAPSAVYSFFKDAVEEAGANNIDFSSIFLKLKSNKLRTLSWNESSFLVEQNSVRFDGQWDENGVIEGRMDITGRKGRRKFELAGHRDRPRMIKK